VLCLPLLVGRDEHAALTWNLSRGRLTLDGEPVAPTGLFIRHDAFSGLEDPRQSVEWRAHGWHTAVLGWALAHPEVRLLNRACATVGTNKPYVLCRAAEMGLVVPHTVVTNELERLLDVAEDHPIVAKPVAGGDYCVPLEEAARRAPLRDGLAATPAIAQERLVPPEVRIYWVEDAFFAFTVTADALDYRTSASCRIEPLALEQVRDLLEPLRRLTDALGMSFGAADFKASASTGELVFLEVNNQPMFAAFDAVCEGAISQRIVTALAASSEMSGH